MSHSTTRPGMPVSLGDVAAAARGFGRASASVAPAAPAAAPDRVSAILGHAEAVGREQQAQYIARNTDLSVEQAVSMLKAGPRGAALASAMAGAGAMRAHLGLPPDTARDAAIARDIEAFLASGGGDAPAASSGKSDADEFAEGAASARRILGR